MNYIIAKSVSEFRILNCQVYHRLHLLQIQLIILSIFFKCFIYPFHTIVTFDNNLKLNFEFVQISYNQK